MAVRGCGIAVELEAAFSNKQRRRVVPGLFRRASSACCVARLRSAASTRPSRTMPFAQLVIGPPGSGKSTYCDGMQQFMAAIERPCSVVNLDPANDRAAYRPALDVRDLVTIDEIMEQEALGPNGGVLYALEELEQNFEWLQAGLAELGDDYILFDCPGQVELFTHHSSLRNIFFRLQKLGYRVLLLRSHWLPISDCYIARSCAPY